jgi:alkanesulfonate monooxygenase SsuD/methylene tetrahydromethanopterin reductase-like flavin-dependent oxidoreductase (luciferase family)
MIGPDCTNGRLAVRYGVGLDATLGLTFDEHRQLAREASELGYVDAWTPAGATGRDSFHVCAQWWGATQGRDGGLRTGISVVPVPNFTATSLAAEAGTVSELTGGRFVLGIGTGAIQDPGARRQYGLPEWPAVGMMRDYLVTIRGLLAGETVDHAGKAVTLRGVKLGFKPPPTPVYLAALGPQMLRLAGEAADGVLPNWASTESIAWCREQVAEGARKAGRDPAAIPIVQYIRVCVDEDEDRARRAFAKNVIPYATARPGQSKEHGYRGHFARMGFDAALTDLETRRDRGAGIDELAEAFPAELMRKVGYFGRPEGASAAFRELANGLDTAIVRVIASRGPADGRSAGAESARAAMQACRPELLDR